MLCAAQVAVAAPKRELPDYEGRGMHGEHVMAPARKVLRWIPRALLAPVYVVTEYLVRRPIGFALRHASSVEGGGDPDDPAHRLLLPIARFDSEAAPAVGVYYATDRFRGSEHRVRLEAETWGPRFSKVTALDRYALDADSDLAARVELARETDHLFLGIGPDARDALRSRYGADVVEGTLAYRYRLGAASRLELAAGAQRVAFIGGDFGDDPSLDERIADGTLAAPPGYRDHFAIGFARAQLAIDTRHPRWEPGSGGFLEVHASGDRGAGAAWLGYGGTIGASVDLTGHERIITLQLALDLVDAAHGTIPFTAYPIVTSEMMPGFATGWMTGPSTAAAQLGYAWPIWGWLDGRARFTVGNAFGEHLAGLSPSNLRLSGDLGIVATQTRDLGIEALVGFGSETIGEGAGLASVRVVIGARRQF